MTPIIISRSPNISLYPTLTLGKNGELVCAWYEYTSPHEPARSDIWCSVSKNGTDWIAPVNVSGEVSYNNGPGVLWSTSGDYLLAWHSWRDPGKEPFTPDGDICNIFLARSSDGYAWTAPRIAFKQLFNTEYATLVQGEDDLLRVFFIHRDSQRLYVSKSKDGVQWEKPVKLPGFIAQGKYPDVAVGPDKALYLVFVGQQDRESLWLTTSQNGQNWSEPQPIAPLADLWLTRPKISIDLNGRIWVACHSETWGSHTAKYAVRLRGPQLELTVRSNQTPGNFCWALNAIEITCMQTGAGRFFTFGPDGTSNGHPMINVTDKNYRYTPEKGYGFDGSVKSILRELGDEITRTLFYSDEPRKFVVDLPQGEYEIKIIYSSWIASTPGTSFQFNADRLYVEHPEIVSDSVFVFGMDKGKCIFSDKVNMDKDCDNNRPSKVVHTMNGKKYLAWTKYGPQSIDVVMTSFSGLK